MASGQSPDATSSQSPSEGPSRLSIRTPQYLKDTLIEVKKIPKELCTNMKKLQIKDMESRLLLQSIDEQVSNLLEQISETGVNEDTEKEKACIKKQFDTIKDVSDSKIKLSTNAYELMDDCIRMVDENIARYQNDIERRRRQRNRSNREFDMFMMAMRLTGKTYTVAQEQAVAAAAAEAEAEAEAAAAKAAASSGNKGKKKKKKNGSKKPAPEQTAVSSSGSKDKKNGSEKPTSRGLVKPSRAISSPISSIANVHSDMSVVSDEPTYCLCDKVSYGSMIGCDNFDCPIEWFHIECVGVEKIPKKKWYCPSCRLGRKEKKKGRKKTK